MTASKRSGEAQTIPNDDHPDHHRISVWQQQQDALWQDVADRFVVQEPSLRRVWHDVQANLLAIVEEALQGQCIQGGVPGTCKASSVAALRTLLERLAAVEENEAKAAAAIK